MRWAFLGWIILFESLLHATGHRLSDSGSGSSLEASAILEHWVRRESDSAEVVSKQTQERGGINSERFKRRIDPVLNGRSMRQAPEEILLQLVHGDDVTANFEHAAACGELVRRVSLREVDEVVAVKGISEHLARVQGRGVHVEFPYEFGVDTINRFIAFLKHAKCPHAKEVLEDAYYVGLSHSMFRQLGAKSDYEDIGWESYLEGLAQLGKMPADVKAASIKYKFIDGRLGSFISVDDVKRSFEYLLASRYYRLASELLDVAQRVSVTGEEKEWVDAQILRIESCVASRWKR